MHEITQLVRDQLNTDLESRDDDRVLYVRICKRINPLTSTLPFADVFERPQMFGLPNYDSVSRVRRKLQEENPALRCSKHASGKRYEKWKEVREYVTTAEV